MKNKIFQQIFNHSNGSNRRGFTIIETVLAISIFAIATTYSLSIFVQSNSVQKRTANMVRTLSDARYVLEMMAREFRMGQIDYSYYGQPLPAMPLSGDNAVLAILDPDNNQILFRRAESTTPGRYVIQMYNEPTDEWLDITPEDLNVSRLNFYLSPGTNPFIWQAGGYGSNSQPLLTIILETESLLKEGQTMGEARVSHFQTTVASRKYSR